MGCLFLRQKRCRVWNQEVVEVRKWALLITQWLQHAYIPTNVSLCIKKKIFLKKPSSTGGKEGFNSHGIWNLSQTFAHLVWSLLLKCLWNLKCKNVWKLGFFFNTNHWNLVLYLFFLFFGKLESPAQKNLFLDDILQARDHTRESKKKKFNFNNQ